MAACGKCGGPMRRPGRYHLGCGPDAAKHKCAACGETVQEVTALGMCGWCENKPLRLFMVRRRNAVRASAEDQCRKYCRFRASCPCRSCLRHAVTLFRAADLELADVARLMEYEAQRYVSAIEDMSLPRSAATWRAQDRTVEWARSLGNAAGAVWHQIMRQAERKTID